ncbi:hypothetical protein ABZ816_15705 [Actinosynnema sp. NPDC047251]|uniref:DUF6896 domain-containing protein n=1 Tax=Saccharothrix espanaensis (strain ATCC 51144 / DSM 44229 / JCM 9112 / NBRC 15066 / NRRL 15764) TaxID=1179773 RepID=K0JXT9_SACES|nr:hypothetical protein [Saccharothrix espanaensis]CCH29534.1 hypothetical protein BN6_22130 [Saccharothrix espanaensis DSM 44229]
MPPSHPEPEAWSGDLPAPDVVARSVVRGRRATFAFSPQAEWAQVLAAAEGLRAGLPGDLLVIASPGTGSGRPPALVVVRLIDEAEAGRLRDRLHALVAEFRELAHRLAAPFRRHVEPAYDQEDCYPDELEVDGETWSLHIHGEHCLFTGLRSGTDIEVHTEHPDAIDPGFLLRYAESTGRHPEVRAACQEGFHDLARLLDLCQVRTGA